MSRTVDAAAVDVREQAACCADLNAVARAVSSCVACPSLAESRTQVVAGDFPANPRFLVIGEAPGAAEDLSGRPFVGRAGALLDKLLADAGVARSEVAVTNVCRCRPPGNRTPSTLEARRCAGWLDRQVDLIDPGLVLALGRTALTWAIGTSVTLASTRGRAMPWRGRQLLISYHPSAAIRFGPRGEPRAALAADLALAAQLTS